MLGSLALYLYSESGKASVYAHYITWKSTWLTHQFTPLTSHKMGLPMYEAHSME